MSLIIIRRYAQNLADYFERVRIACELIDLSEPDDRPELSRCLEDDAAAMIGFNSQLDHCWLGDENFVDAAALAEIPVIHRILDPPSTRWHEFIDPISPAARFRPGRAQKPL